MIHAHTDWLVKISKGRLKMISELHFSAAASPLDREIAHTTHLGSQDWHLERQRQCQHDCITVTMIRRGVCRLVRGTRQSHEHKRPVILEATTLTWYPVSIPTFDSYVAQAYEWVRLAIRSPDRMMFPRISNQANNRLDMTYKLQWLGGWKAGQLHYPVQRPPTLRWMRSKGVARVDVCQLLANTKLCVIQINQYISGNPVCIHDIEEMRPT